MTNSSQTVTGTISFEGFGQTIATTGSSGNPYMFAATSGYRNDNDAGLMHVGARYYDAQVGRFITRDTDLDEHPYLYCEHDPVNHLDPSGHQTATAAAARLAGGVEIAGGGPEDPVADIIAIGIIFGGIIIDIGNALVRPSKSTTPPGGMPRSRKVPSVPKPDPGKKRSSPYLPGGARIAGPISPPGPPKDRLTELLINLIGNFLDM